jgi:hypothetical protein
MRHAPHSPGHDCQPFRKAFDGLLCPVGQQPDLQSMRTFEFPFCVAQQLKPTPHAADSQEAQSDALQPMHGVEPQQTPPDGATAGHLPVEAVPLSGADASRAPGDAPESPRVDVPVESFVAAPETESAGAPSGERK